MAKIDKQVQIGETLAEVLRGRLMELETLEAAGDAPGDILGRLAFVRKLLIQFDAKNATQLDGSTERPF